MVLARTAAAQVALSRLGYATRSLYSQPDLWIMERAQLPTEKT